MNEIIIDCTGLENPRQLHEILKEKLALPEWYGYNLDALYDCLTSITKDISFTLEHFMGLPEFSKGFFRVFQDAAGKNPHLHITLS